MKCEAKLDVVLLIDGSASLQKVGWLAMQIAAENIANAMGADVQLSALLFSGPTSKEKYFQCTGQLWPNRETGKSLGTPDMEKDCLVKWVEHFTSPDNGKKVAASIKKMEWPRGSTLTSEALSLAETELNAGRKEAQSVVIVLSDGKTMNKRKVLQATTRLRRKARVMWLATANAPWSLLRKWSSLPVRENVLPVKGYEALMSTETVNKVVSNMCPAVGIV